MDFLSSSSSSRIPIGISLLSTLQDHSTTLNETEGGNSTDGAIDPAVEATLMGAKLGTLFGLFIGSFLISLIPVIFSRVKFFKKRINSGYISIVIDQCNGFAGGVLLSVGILHMMTEGGELISDGLVSLGDTQSSVFPLGPLTMCLAFLTLYGLEFVLLAFLSKWFKAGEHDHSHSHSHGHGHSHHDHDNCKEEHTLTSNGTKLPPPSISTIGCVDEIEMVKPHHHHSHQHNNNNNKEEEEGSPSSPVSGGDDINDLENPPTPQIEKPTTNEPTVCDQHHVHHEHGHGHGDHTGCAHHEATQMLFETNHKSGVPLVLTAIVLWLALSTHSIFIGLGFGAETDLGNMWSIFAAIVAHQFIEAFSLGAIVEKGCKNLIVALALLILYAASVPVGIAIGLVIIHAVKNEQALENNSWKVAQGVLLSIAAGAFLYVSLMEIAIHQPKNKYLKLSRFILMLLGFAFMAIIAIWA